MHCSRRLQRTAILTSDKFKGVRLNIDPGSLRVASNNAEQEEAVDELDIDYGGDSIEIGFNVTYLIDALTNMSQDMVHAGIVRWQQLSAIHHSRQRHLQIRGDAHENLTRKIRCFYIALLIRATQSNPRPSGVWSF
jgi:DNA polymerase III sliding clamp (beta) subunit (PCNA family)